ncbi:MAG: MerR family transcriptional regulator [Aequoribacter sp.]|uniref:MerR family transcriptional regulator n=1 Tax=Aequoribacter sp. TaxID=2847771 RepID=UPI003C4C4407
MKQMSIGQLSKQAGVKVTTIRYYESIGLIAEPERSQSGRRLYGEEAVQTLSFVRHGRDLGFSMNAIERLLTLQQVPDQNCESVNNIAREQLGAVQKRLRQLHALEEELQRTIRACKGGSVSDCRIISTLNDHGECLSDRHERVSPL